MKPEYNTQRTDLKLRAYGRNVQHLAERLKNIGNKEERNKKAATIVKLMKLINPDINKDSTENDQKIWDDLHIISDFELDVTSPFPKPDKKVLGKKPERMKHCSNEIKYKHYGRNIELLVECATAAEDPKEKERAVVMIGKLMRRFYRVWNKDTIEDEQILRNIKKLSDNQLDINIETVRELGLFNSERRSTGRSRHLGSSRGRSSESSGRRSKQEGRSRRHN